MPVGREPRELTGVTLENHQGVRRDAWNTRWRSRPANGRPGNRASRAGPGGSDSGTGPQTTGHCQYGIALAREQGVYGTAAPQGRLGPRRPYTHDDLCNVM